MPAMTRICGRRLTIATWRMCLPSKARSLRPSPTSCRRSFRLTRRTRSSNARRHDVAAFDLYSRAKNLIFNHGFSAIGRQKLEEASSLLNQALAARPFILCCAVPPRPCPRPALRIGSRSYSGTVALAEAAVDAAIRLRPEAGESHLARASIYTMAYRDYDGALAELEIARRTLPNDPAKSSN